MEHPVSEEVRYQLLKYVAEHPQATQRDLAAHLGVSVGKVNYCVRALIERGWVKVRNFTNSNRKAAYAYHLTPAGLEEKVLVTYRFLQRKVAERDALLQEIEDLRAEVDSASDTFGERETGVSSTAEPPGARDMSSEKGESRAPIGNT